MLYIVRAYPGYQPECGEVIAVHDAHDSSIYHDGAWDYLIESETAPADSQPATDGWFDDEEGGGALVSNGGTRWEPFETEENAMESAS